MTEVEDPGLSLFSNSELFVTGGDSDDSGLEEGGHSPAECPLSTSISESRGSTNRGTSPESSTQPKRKTRQKNKLTKNDMLRMHSDSQRLIRESAIKLPQYQPKTKTLDSFLIKIKSRSSTLPSQDLLKKATPKIMSTTTPSQATIIEHIFDEVQPSHDQSHDIPNDKENIPDNELTPNIIEDNDMSSASQADTIIPTEDSTGDNNDASTIASEKKQSSIQNWFSRPSSEAPLPVSSSSSEVPAVVTQDKPLPPSLSSIDHWSEVVMTAPQLTPIELLQRRFLRHTQKVTSKPAKPVQKTSHDDVIAGLLLDNDIGQVAHKPGAIREKLRLALKAQLSQQKAEERKKMEEMRKLDNEEISDVEINEEEAEFSDDEGSDNNEMEASDNEEAETSDNDSDNEDDIQKNDDDILFVPSRKARPIISDDEETTSDVILHHNEVTAPPPLHRSSISIEGSMGPLLLTESLDDIPKVGSPIDKEKQDEPVLQDIPVLQDEPVLQDIPVLQDEPVLQDIPVLQDEPVLQDVPVLQDIPVLQDVPVLQDIPVLQDEPVLQDGSVVDDDPINNSLTLSDVHDDVTQLVGDNDSDDMTYQLGQSLPSHQIPRITREESDELFTPVMTRQNSTISSISDKDLFQDSSAWGKPPPDHPQFRRHSLIDEETQFLDANGFLCVRNQAKYHSFHSTAINNIIETQQPPSTDDILGLCSGQFTTPQNNKPNRMFDFSSINDTQNSDDVLGLCSGVFSTLPPHKPAYDSSDDDDMPKLSRKRICSKAPPITNSDRLQEFVESEAELSGSDVGPDEIEEDDEELNIYEEEEGAGSDVPLSDTELWDQVNQVHLKQLQADDKADLRDIKERFLLEGDLYEDGMCLKNGFFRTRRFAHGSEASMDLFAEERANELQIEEDIIIGSQAEAKRRKERLERQEFIRKCQERQANLLICDEDSQSILGLIKETSCSSLLKTPDPSSHAHQPISSTKRSSCGSFLKHKSSTLQRLSSYTAATPTVGSGRGFIFTSSNSNDATPASTNKVKNVSPKDDNNQQIKRPKLDKSISLTIGSIFDQL